MKTLLTKIEFHYTYLIMVLGLVLTGHFLNLIVFTSIIIVHELGHSIIAYLFKYDIDKIIIYPYGGLTKLNKLVNTNIYKDILVSISGLIMQTIYFYIIYILYNKGLVREYTYNLFYTYHSSMLIFNILPIIPLDGSKFINLILCKIFNFNLSNYLTVLISFITIIIILLGGYFDSNYSFLLVIFVLLHNIYLFYNDIKYLYNRFLLERYLYNINYPKKSIISDINKMYKNRSHLFMIEGNIIGERVYISNYFKK